MMASMKSRARDIATRNLIAQKNSSASSRCCDVKLNFVTEFKYTRNESEEGGDPLELLVDDPLSCFGRDIKVDASSRNEI